MLNSSPYNYGDTYILVKGNIIVAGEGISKSTKAADINNMQVDNAKDLDVVMTI